jgi:ATP-dependent protease ClpP protease subunit
MFHQSSYGLSGSHEQVKQEVEQMEKEEKLWAKWISSMSTKSEGFWYTVVQKKNVYLVADKLLAYGVVDEIL